MVFVEKKEMVELAKCEEYMELAFLQKCTSAESIFLTQPILASFSFFFLPISSLFQQFSSHSIHPKMFFRSFFHFSRNVHPKHTLFFSLFGFSLFSFNGSSSTSSNQSLQKLSQGNLLFHQGDYDEAMKVLDEAIAEWKRVDESQSENSEIKPATLDDSQNIDESELKTIIQCFFLRASLHRYKSEMRDAIVNLREAKTKVQRRVESLGKQIETMKQGGQDVALPTTHTNSLDEMTREHKYWRAWAHTLDGSLLELLYGREQDAGKQFQQAIVILPDSSKMSRNMAQYFHRLGLLDYAEFHTKEALRKDDEFCPQLRKKVNPNIQVGTITERNADLVLQQIGRAEDYELLAQFHLAKQEFEDSLQYSDKSFGMVRNSFFGVMTKSRCLHQMGRSPEGVTLLRDYMKHVQDRESQARLSTWASVLSQKALDEAREEAEILIGDYARTKIAELDQLLEACNNTVEVMDANDGLPTYPSIVEYLKRRQQYKTLILDLVGVAQDEERIRQVSAQMDMAYNKNQRRDSL
uniref:Uncharacterized protein n=1 Tax=Percolomonas cosmopolitus TaxID=63605 RepID=A0A7S1PGI8_9EUKA|mmetsp:Transcript_3248/g.12383  ORF Transcript_3248/g.12383 Transcript_3248/m.12383 type:complete len:524 (+) Transcript_3248:385-1956(+)